jgi:hypothetical protein
LYPSSKETNMLIYDYEICKASITRTNSIKDLGMFIDTKFHFHNHVNHVSSHCIKLFGLVRSITFTLSFLERMNRLYFNRFDQCIARQQLCKHGPTRNNRRNNNRRVMRWREFGESWIMRSLITCNLHQV